MKKLLIILVFLIPATSFAQEKERAGVPAGHIYLACKNYFANSFNTRENIARRSTCSGYFFGVGSALLSLQASGKKTGLCLPKTTTTKDVIEIFLLWYKQNDDKRNMLAIEAVLTSLGAAYQC